MSFLRILFYFMFLFWVVVSFQINLDLTELTNENDVMLQHDCLYTTVLESEINHREDISFCMSEWPSEWKVHENTDDRKFYFYQLSKLNITSQQLYLWSTPMYIVENYQLYLNQLSISNEMAMHIYYNCTLPRFGSICQYSFDDYKPHFSSLNDMIDELYFKHSEKLISQTCYTHLQCDLGTSLLCISWINICDGIIQCIDGIDEEHCWELEINKCKENEHRCKNGQCIPMIFLNDSMIAPDCFDGSDEALLFSRIKVNSVVVPSKYEDSICMNLGINMVASIPHYCRDTYAGYFERLKLRDRSDPISDECWTALKCYFESPQYSDLECTQIPLKKKSQEIIQAKCPEMFYMPNAPFAFGHIYLAYTKNYIVNQSTWTDMPEYLCYNDKLCNGFYPNRTLRSFNNATCRRLQDFPLTLFSSMTQLVQFATRIYKELPQCNTIFRNDSAFCNQSTMYQCVNSSKCISNIRLFDGTRDCDYGDDELGMLEDGSCPIESSEMLFNCTIVKKCISRKRVEDKICDCGYDTYNLCEDEHSEVNYFREHISFTTICDGFNELKPILIDGRNETDETECEQWLCNNTYTRCNGIRNCFDGADEINCYPWAILNCPIDNHMCVSPETSDFICYHLNKTNDGNIDCLGGTDESLLYQANGYLQYAPVFYCMIGKTNFSTLRYPDGLVCNGVNDCLQGDDEQFCSNIEDPNINGICGVHQQQLPHSDIEEFICNHINMRHKPQVLHFSLDKVTKSSKQTTNTVFKRSSFTPIIPENHQHYCHRSLSLRVWLDSKNNVTILTCLCSSSFYGDRCQYQNQRVSLTIQFRAFSDSWHTPFICIVLLIDDSIERIVHSYEQHTFLPIQNCKTKYNIDLLYLTRPKNQSKQYSIHIDIYEKYSLAYRGSLLIPAHFSFLPVQRIVILLNIPPTTDNFRSCSDPQCIHGQCIRYFDDPKSTTFCQCDREWSGRYCTIPYTCTCASGTLCHGILANNRSLCVCPIYKWGSRCLLDDVICQSNTTCHNNGQCIPVDKKFICICSKGFSGYTCEIAQHKIILSFGKEISLSQSMFVHFIEVKDNTQPEIGSTTTTIPIHRKSVTIYWSHPFHIAVAQLLDNNYYLIIVQKTYNQSVTTVKTLKPSDRCMHINEVLNSTIVQFHLIRRVKYYHLPCQRRSPQIPCFYDDTHICLCNDFGQQRQANCFEFNYTIKRDCAGQSKCEHGAQCLQDRVNCPERSICVCLPCFYGTLCEFNSNGFGLSLDAILGYHIQPHINIIEQPLIVQISLTLTVLIGTVGLANGILSMMTFLNTEPRKTGCGFYLIGSSITTLLTITLFLLKFSILMIAQMTYMTHRSFLRFQCNSIDFLLRIGLSMDQWLNACIAIERAIMAIQGIGFNKIKSKKVAKFAMSAFLIFTICTHVHDPYYRRLIVNEHDDVKRIWCTVTYPPTIQIFNSIMNIFHICVPFIINLLSAIIIIIKTTRLRTTVKIHLSYRKVFQEQFRQHKHLVITPILLIILAIPRLIISFTSGCMKTADDSWLFLMGYFISFFPIMLTFIIFVLPSKMYKQEFDNTIRRYWKTIRARLCRVS